MEKLPDSSPVSASDCRDPQAAPTVSLEETAKTLLTEPIAGLGYQLLEVQFVRTRRTVVRVMIDKDDGIGLKDCSKVSELVGRFLDVEDLVQGSYRLEVTSPGLFRRLRQVGHFVQSIGKRAKIFLDTEWARNSGCDKTMQPVQTGIIENVQENLLHLRVTTETLIIPLEKVHTAHLEPKLDYH